jgi:microcystin-dependent protein
MSDPFLGELKLMSFVFPPKGWALCNGQILSIAQNQALFALLGTTYGGNGQTTFALPDLRGRVPQHAATTFGLGAAGGTTAVTLSPEQMPAHSHGLVGTGDLANASVPGGALPAAKPRGGINRYAPAGAPTPMGVSAISVAGGNQPHDNMQPYLTLSWVIALVGVFPSRD